MRHLFLLVVFFFATARMAQAQCNTNEYTRIFNEASALQEKGEFIDAKNRYEAAKIYACNQREKDEADGKVDRLFNQIELLRKEAENAKAEARISLVQVMEEQEKTKKALLETEKSRLQVDSALKKANKIIDAFYFYKGQFALAFNNNLFYFIDKNGERVDKLGKWDKAEQFEYRGFAKVKKVNSRTYLLLDTAGNTYPVAYGLRDINNITTAFYVVDKVIWPFGKKKYKLINLKIFVQSNSNLVFISSKIGNLKNLTYVDFSINSFERLPPEIGKLKNLAFLNLSNTGLKTLPIEIGELVNLKSLDLSSTNLINLPNEIGNLQKLQTLDLSRNKFICLPMNALTQMQNLKQLDLYGNPLKKEDVETVRQLLPRCEIKW